MTPPDPQELAWFPTNDRGNALRMKARAGGLLRWVDEGEQAGYWIGFDGQRWDRRSGERQARLLADEVADCLREEAASLALQIESGKLPRNMPRERAEERLTELRRWALKSGNAGQTDGMLKKAKPIMAIEHDAFDPDPLALNLRNGTLRFVAPAAANSDWTVRLDPHDPGDMITRMADVDFDPVADCPQWLARLEHIQPEPDQRAMMQRIHGYALLGLRSEQKFILAQGRGGDGKTLSYSVIAAIMGDYYRHADVQSFLKGGTKSGSDHSEDLARLAGDTRLVTCDEPERFATFNSKIIKQMTGGGKMTVRALRAASMEITPRWLLIMECNPLPRVPTSDDGFWRRCMPFQWPVQLTQAEQASSPFDVLRDSLLAERAGILNWMIAGACAWLGERDLKASKRSIEVKEAYRNSSDPFTEWYRTRCVTGEPSDPTLREKGADLHADFKLFCEDELGIDGAKIPGQRAFGTQLDERQHPNRKTMGNKWRFGIRLKRRDELDAADAADRVQEQARDAASGLGSSAAGDDEPEGWDG